MCHASFFEAEACARWAEAHLPTEFEWEHAAAALAPGGNLMESGALHPLPLAATPTGRGPAQMFGDVWQWTRSDYAPYPGYRAAAGAIGECDVKFMSGR